MILRRVAISALYVEMPSCAHTFLTICHYCNLTIIAYAIYGPGPVFGNPMAPRVAMGGMPNGYNGYVPVNPNANMMPMGSPYNPYNLQNRYKRSQFMATSGAQPNFNPYTSGLNGILASGTATTLTNTYNQPSECQGLYECKFIAEISDVKLLRELKRLRVWFIHNYILNNQDEIKNHLLRRYRESVLQYSLTHPVARSPQQLQFIQNKLTSMETTIKINNAINNVMMRTLGEIESSEPTLNENVLNRSH